MHAQRRHFGRFSVPVDDLSGIHIVVAAARRRHQAHIALVDRPGSLGGVVKHHAQRGVEHDLIFTEQRRVTLAEDVGLVLLQIVDVVRITLARQRVDRELQHLAVARQHPGVAEEVLIEPIVRDIHARVRQLPARHPTPSL